jgi:protein-serine/threonine kinase
MEYCAGGDLLSKMIGVGFSGFDEIACLFKQLLRGIEYMHNTGVVHRDLKPENLLLDSTHRYLKITDFGVAVVFRTQFEKEARKVQGLCGSVPYIAPEEWIEKSEYLPTKVDIWASGMIFYTMISKNLLWGCSQESDQKYCTYLKKRETGYPPFEMQDPPQKELLYRILDPDASKRPEAVDILHLEWVESIKVCETTSDPLQNDSFAHEHLHS